MRRRDILRALEAAGLRLVEGGDHTKVYRGDRLVTTVPRHAEINEMTVRNIGKRAGVDLKGRER